MRTGRSRQSRRFRRALALAGVFPVLVSPGTHLPARAGDHVPATDRHRGVVLYEVFSPDGTIHLLPARGGGAPPGSAPAATPAVTTILDAGRVANRYSFTFVGDGYTATQLITYAQNVTSLVGGFILGYQPFKTYRNYLNMYRVDLVSPVSGISNDPVNGVTRNTPLSMRFWCNGIDRLLCVDNAKALAYAAYAPARDNVIAVANTTTYGGSGGVVTAVSGRNASSGQTVVHEMGHSIGKLSDEYDYPYFQATGVEPSQPNSSAYTDAQMRQYSVKWYRWLGAATPDGGTIGSYEGGNQFKIGNYRPSLNSVMRTLGQRFNSIGAEAIIETIYRKVRPIDYATTQTTQTRASTVQVIPMRPVGYNLTVSWALDGRVLTSAANRTTLALSTVAMTAGRHTLTVTVADPTSMVRDAAFRAQYMTQTLTYPVTAS